LRAGELPLSVSVRELKEELDIEGVPSFLSKYKLPKITSFGYTEYEIAYALEVNSDAEFILDPTEVAKVRFFHTRIFEKNCNIIQKN
jgi:isopentenyldiphosphate isomerase